MTDHRIKTNDNVEELLDLADAALKNLREAYDFLEEAKEWGIIDMVGGGLIITGVKHHKIAKAQTEMDQAVDYIRKLEKKLEYTDYTAKMNLFSGSMMIVMDFLLDNPITDILEQNHIKEMMEDVELLIGRLELMQEELYGGGVSLTQ